MAGSFDSLAGSFEALAGSFESLASSFEAPAGSFEARAGRFEAKVAKTLRMPAKSSPRGCPRGAAAACLRTLWGYGKTNIFIDFAGMGSVLAILGKRTQPKACQTKFDKQKDVQLNIQVLQTRRCSLRAAESLRFVHPAEALGGLEAWRLGGLGTFGRLVCLIWNKKSSKVELQ